MAKTSLAREILYTRQFNSAQRRVVWMWFGALPGAFGLGRAQPQRRGTSPCEKDLESPSSTRLEALVPSRDSRARTRSPSPHAALQAQHLPEGAVERHAGTRTDTQTLAGTHAT